jgi:hypothetical protein
MEYGIIITMVVVWLLAVLWSYPRYTKVNGRYYRKALPFTKPIDVLEEAEKQYLKQNSSCKTKG